MSQYNKSVTICGIVISNVNYGEIVDEIGRYISLSKPVYIITTNVDHIVKLQKDIEFKQAYNSASLAVADGMPILWTARFLGTKPKFALNENGEFYLQKKPLLYEDYIHSYLVDFLIMRIGALSGSFPASAEEFPALPFR